MAKEVKDNKENKETTAPVERKLLTEEEYEKLARDKFKAKLSQISRVFGIITILLLIYVAILDPLFEGSFFGALFANEEYHAFWKVMSTADMIGEGMKIWDDPLQFYMTWVPALGYTIAIIAAVTFAVYLVVYSVADLIGLFKQLYGTFHDVTRDLKGGLVDGVNKEVGTIERKPKKKRGLFSKKDKTETTDAPAENTENTDEKKPGKKRRKEKDLGLDDSPEYTPEQLDILLAGGTIPETTGTTDEKPLF